MTGIPSNGLVGLVDLVMFVLIALLALVEVIMYRTVTGDGRTREARRGGE